MSATLRRLVRELLVTCGDVLTVAALVVWVLAIAAWLVFAAVLIFGGAW